MSITPRSAEVAGTKLVGKRFQRKIGRCDVKVSLPADLGHVYDQSDLTIHIDQLISSRIGIIYGIPVSRRHSCRIL